MAWAASSAVADSRLDFSARSASGRAPSARSFRAAVLRSALGKQASVLSFELAPADVDLAALGREGGLSLRKGVLRC